MARLSSRRRKLSATAARAKFDESKHRRVGGKFADKPGAGDDAPKTRMKIGGVFERGNISGPAGKRVVTRGNVPPETETALRQYAGTPQAAAMNHSLRQGWPLSTRESEISAGLDAGLAQSSLTDNATLFRGVSPDFGARLGTMRPGDVLTDAGYVSTSRDPIWASTSGGIMASRAGEPGFVSVMEIQARAGTPALEPTHNAIEQEVIFGRGTRLRYLGKSQNRYRFDLERD